jgi:hypothetical protein
MSSLVTFAAPVTEKIDTLSKMDVYLLPNSVLRKGDDISYKLIFDFKTTDKIGKKSFKSTSTNFGGNRSGGITTERLNVFYVENMAQVKVLLWDNGDPEFKLGLPDYLASKYTDIVCKTK